LKGLSSSLLKTLEKKLHNASALLLSADATCAFPWLSTYFKSLIGSLLVVFDLAFFQKCLEFCLHAAAMSFWCFYQPSFVPDFVSNFLYCIYTALHCPTELSLLLTYRLHKILFCLIMLLSSRSFPFIFFQDAKGSVVGIYLYTPSSNRCFITLHIISTSPVHCFNSESQSKFKYSVNLL